MILFSATFMVSGPREWSNQANLEVDLQVVLMFKVGGEAQVVESWSQAAGPDLAPTADAG